MRLKFTRGFVAAVIVAASVVVVGLIGLRATHRPFRIPTNSMRQALHHGDMFYARLVGGDYRPRVGEILVFRSPTDHSVDYVKRCVAVAGDSVVIRDDVLYVNGRVYESNFADPDGDHGCIPDVDGGGGCPEPCTYRDSTVPAGVRRMGQWPPRAGAEPYVVPAGHVFVLGDNRYNSMDSRHLGPVANDLVIARASFFYWSPSEPGRFLRRVR